MERYPARKYASLDHVGDFGNAPVEACTSSLDAAMSLLDQRWGYEQRRPSDSGKACYATIWWVPDFPGKVQGIRRPPLSP